MNIIAVDDERQLLNMLAETIKDVQPDADVTGFTASREALELRFRRGNFYGSHR